MNPPTAAELKRLPLRAIVAYAVRWAERVRPAWSQANPPLAEDRQSDIDAAIKSAKDFVEGKADPADPKMAMPLALKAKSLGGAIVNAAGPEDSSQVRFSTRTAALALETLAQALCAFGTLRPAEADDIIEPDDPLDQILDGASLMAHSAGYSGQFVLDEARIKETVSDDYSILQAQCAGHSSPIGDPLDMAAMGPLWSGDVPEWPISS